MADEDNIVLTIAPKGGEPIFVAETPGDKNFLKVCKLLSNKIQQITDRDKNRIGLNALSTAQLVLIKKDHGARAAATELIRAALIAYEVEIEKGEEKLLTNKEISNSKTTFTPARKKEALRFRKDLEQKRPNLNTSDLDRITGKNFGVDRTTISKLRRNQL